MAVGHVVVDVVDAELCVCSASFFISCKAQEKHCKHEITIHSNSKVFAGKNVGPESIWHARQLSCKNVAVPNELVCKFQSAIKQHCA